VLIAELRDPSTSLRWASQKKQIAVLAVAGDNDFFAGLNFGDKFGHPVFEGRNRNVTHQKSFLARIIAIISLTVQRCRTSSSYAAPAKKDYKEDDP
jgi:hypothetical protein